MAKYLFVQNDTRPSIQEALQRPDGTPVNLTGCTVMFNMIRVGSLTYKVRTEATIVTAAVGLVRYDWGGDDLDTPGTYDCEWEITFGDLTVQTSNPKFQIEIRKQVA